MAPAPVALRQINGETHAESLQFLPTAVAIALALSSVNFLFKGVPVSVAVFSAPSTGVGVTALPSQVYLALRAISPAVTASNLFTSPLGPSASHSV